MLGYVPPRLPGDQAEQNGRVDRLRNEIALGIVAAQLPQPVESLAVFNALGDDLESQFVRQVDSRADHDLVAFAFGEVRDEALVDLKLVHRQVLQVGQGRLTGPIIVYRQPDPAFTQLVEGRNGFG